MLYWLTTITMIVVSLITSKPESYRVITHYAKIKSPIIFSSNSKLIRTTYWTISSKEERPDENKNSVVSDDSADLKISSPSKQNKVSVFPINDVYEGNKGPHEGVKFVNSQVPMIEIQTDVKTMSRSKEIFRKVFLTWICGFDLGDDNKTKKHTPEIVITKEETRFEKWILNINLVFVILTSIVLFIIFSVPNTIITSTNNLTDLKYLNKTKL
jgi:hypothetical protein